MLRLEIALKDAPVAPYAGAWIEMPTLYLLNPGLSRSLPTRERGLKFGVPAGMVGGVRRSLRGSVD